jgi:hypothetical protein
LLGAAMMMALQFQLNYCTAPDWMIIGSAHGGKKIMAQL